MITFHPQKIAEMTRRSGYRMDHDVSYWSSYMGAPALLFGNWVAYISQKDANICNYGFDGTPMCSNRINSAIDYFIGHFDVSYIDIWSDAPVTDINATGWDVSLSSEDPSNVPIQLRLDKAEIFGRQKFVRKAMRQGYRVSQTDGHTLTTAHLRLIKKYTETVDFGTFDASFVGNVQSLLNSGTAFLVEVSLGDDLLAFGTVSTYLDDCWIFYHLFIDDERSLAGDVAYDFVIERAKKCGIKTVDFGYTINSGLKKYKQSLGKVKLFPQTHFAVLKRKDFSVPSGRHFHWALRGLVERSLP